MPDTFESKVTLDLPDDHFDRADVLTKLKPAITAFTSALEESGIKYKVHSGVTKPVTVRKPRAPKAEAPKIVPPAPPAPAAKKAA